MSGNKNGFCVVLGLTSLILILAEGRVNSQKTNKKKKNRGPHPLGSGLGFGDVFHPPSPQKKTGRRSNQDVRKVQWVCS